MQNNDLILDITTVNVDLELDKNLRLKSALKEFHDSNHNNNNYNEHNNKIKINDTVVTLNYIGTEKLSAKPILKVLQLC